MTSGSGSSPDLDSLLGPRYPAHALSPPNSSARSDPLVTDLRFRQIHLDFHTSEQIVGVGSKFDA